MLRVQLAVEHLALGSPVKQLSLFIWLIGSSRTYSALFLHSLKQLEISLNKFFLELIKIQLLHYQKIKHFN